MSTPVRVFISYARRDGSTYAQRLASDLKAQGFVVWRDTQGNPYSDYTGVLDEAIAESSHVVVIVTEDIYRADSFVRLEIAAALAQNKPIIPLVFPGGRRPITIINHTFISFEDWGEGLA